MPLPGSIPCRTSPIAAPLARRSSGFANEGTSAFAVLLVDLDRFKPINDMYGHAVGDLVIKECGRRLAETVGGQGIAARLGGDEFGVVLVGRAGRDGGDRRRMCRKADRRTQPAHFDRRFRGRDRRQRRPCGLPGTQRRSACAFPLRRYGALRGQADGARYVAALFARARAKLPNGKQRWNWRCAVRSPRRKSSPISSRSSTCARARWPSSRCSRAGSIRRMAW